MFSHENRKRIVENKTSKQVVGDRGEEIACDFLKKQGYKIRDRNYLEKWGELDIVAQKGNEIRFVEVKTVSRLRQGYGGQARDNNDYEPEDNIHPWKIKRLYRTIETYLLRKGIDDEVDWQLDAIAVYLNSGGEVLKIEHLEDIF